LDAVTEALMQKERLTSEFLKGLLPDNASLTVNVDRRRS
jgi:hypothetical protein